MEFRRPALGRPQVWLSGPITSAPNAARVSGGAKSENHAYTRSMPWSASRPKWSTSSGPAPRTGFIGLNRGRGPGGAAGGVGGGRGDGLRRGDPAAGAGGDGGAVGAGADVGHHLLDRHAGVAGQ